MLRTLENREEIKVGMEVRFAELWDGNGEGEELIESGAIAVWDEQTESEDTVWFKIIKPAEDILNTLVRVTDII